MMNDDTSLDGILLLLATDGFLLVVMRKAILLANGIHAYQVLGNIQHVTQLCNNTSMTILFIFGIRWSE